MIILVEVTFVFTRIDLERELFPRKAPTVMLTIIAIYIYMILILWYDNPNRINTDVFDVDLGRYEILMLPQCSNWDVPYGLLPNYRNNRLIRSIS